VDCKEKNHIALTPVSTGRAVLLTGVVQSEEYRSWVVQIFLKKSGLSEDDIIDLLVIAPAEKKSAPSGCPRGYGGC
jgi:hypothetical protein